MTVAIPRGQQGAALSVVGAGGAPGVTLRDPRGQTYAMPETGALDSERVLAFKVDQTNTTYVALKRPLAGKWTIEPQGSARIAELRRASVLPKPKVRARVRRRGGSWRVDYRVAPRPGKSCTCSSRRRAAHASWALWSDAASGLPPVRAGRCASWRGAATAALCA